MRELVDRKVRRCSTPCVVIAALGAVVLALGVGACKGKDEGPSAGPAVASSPVTTDAHVAALAFVPQDVDVVASIALHDVVSMLGQPLGGGGERPQALREALSEAFLGSLGVDPLAAGTATVAVAARHQAVVVVFRGVGGDGPLKGEPIAETGLVRLPDGFVAALHEKTLFVGNEKGVAAGLAVARGEAKALAGTPLGAQHAELVGKLGPGMLIATVASPMLAMAWPATGLPGKGIEAGGVSLTYDLRVSAVARGDAASLDAVTSRYEQLMATLRLEVDKLKAQLTGQPGVMPAVALAFVDNAAGSLSEQVRFEREGSDLVAKTDALTMLGGALPMTGVLASVAIPAFIKYMRRARTTEAIDELDKMYKGAAMYFATPKVDRTGTILPCQFPKSFGPTPASSPCDHPDERYPADPAIWDDATWTALSFGVNAPHRYRYAFEWNGETGAAAQFTASAYGDLDCDGVWSTFQRMGFASPDADGHDCSLTGSPAFYVENETE